MRQWAKQKKDNRIVHKKDDNVLLSFIPRKGCVTDPTASGRFLVRGG
jgi:hypothetical protein